MARKERTGKATARSRTPWREAPRVVPLIVAALVALIFAAYWNVGRADFVNLDDDAYVQYQPMVNQGFRPASVVWALTSIHSSNWHPLTTLSHMLDCELFGLRPGPMHWENLLWHTLNSVLVFLVWRAFSGATWRSALVAGLFALHPLHVESVAWISERKDLLSTFFWLLGIGAYTRYVREPSRRRYALVALALILALLAKPMAVTFPCTLLLLDFWPLARWPARSAFALVKEKLPLFALVVAHSVATYIAQHSSGAADFGQRFSLGDRLGNALVAYLRYLGKTVWPSELSPFYPHPGHWPALIVLGAVVFLVSVSAIIWRQSHARGWLAFGWLWFLGTLVPVIGLVQVGAQSMADRYTYIPLLGIFTIVAWGGAEWVRWRPVLRLPLIATTAFALAGSLVLTHRQTSAWENSFKLYERAIANGQDNATVRYLLAVAGQAAGRPEEEIAGNFRRALELEPDYINALVQLAVIAMRQQKTDEPLRLLEECRRLQPSNAAVRLSLGVYYARTNQLDTAIGHFKEALRISPTYADPHRELSRVYVAQMRLEEAKAELEIVVKLAPWNVEALVELGTLEANLRQFEPARKHLERAVWIMPNFPAARENLRALKALMEQPSPQKS